MAVVFSGKVRRWREDKPGGLAVVDVPSDLVAELGGRRQTRVTGTLNDARTSAGLTRSLDDHGLRVSVRDYSTARPAVRPVDATSIRGRGMPLAIHLSDRVGNTAARRRQDHLADVRTTLVTRPGR